MFGFSDPVFIFILLCVVPPSLFHFFFFSFSFCVRLVSFSQPKSDIISISRSHNIYYRLTPQHTHSLVLLTSTVPCIRWVSTTNIHTHISQLAIAAKKRHFFVIGDWDKSLLSGIDTYIFVVIDKSMYP